jgi:signal transduction histidine kinase
MVVIINQHRQVIYANKSYKNFCSKISSEQILGKLLGENLSCINAIKATNGCGTSKACKSCGNYNAILESQKGNKSSKACQIRTNKNRAIDLEVTATPINNNNERLTIFSLLDVSAAKQKESLQRVFIHDILNSAGAISGLSAILKEIDTPNEIKEIADSIQCASRSLIEEIQAQREIEAAELGNLKPDLKTISTHQVLGELQGIYANHEQNSGKPVLIDSASQNHSIHTDPILLKRILGNMIKNAIEIYLPEDIISLKSKKVDQGVVFSIHNQSVIPKEVQDQLFHRFYSTKGSGRGLGTYSMKLLGENYLKGKVWFESSEDFGTTFYIKLN